MAEQSLPAGTPEGSFMYNGGIATPAIGDYPPTWKNISGSSQWMTLANGLRQFVSDQESVDLSQETFEMLLPGGFEAGLHFSQSTACP